MRFKRHLVAAGLGAGLVWFNHPTEGARRREEVREQVDNAKALIRRVTGGTIGNDDKSFDKTTGTTGESAPVPRHAATLLEVVAVAEQNGISSEFDVTNEAAVRCGACGTESSPDSVRREWMHRLEGASDPDEMVTVSAISCPSCGARGLLILPFGPSADENQGDVSRRLPEPAHADMAPLDALREAV